MTIHCPACQSQQVITKDRGKKTGGIIGLIGGASAGAIGVAQGARTGASVLAFTGPVGLTIGAAGGAILGGLVYGTSGAIAGANLGKKLDLFVLNNYQCKQCGHHFSKPNDPTPNHSTRNDSSANN